MVDAQQYRNKCLYGNVISVAAPPRWLISGGPYVSPVPLEDELVRQAERNVERAESLVPEDVPVSSVRTARLRRQGDPGTDRDR